MLLSLVFIEYSKILRAAEIGFLIPDSNFIWKTNRKGKEETLYQKQHQHYQIDSHCSKKGKKKREEQHHIQRFHPKSNWNHIPRLERDHLQGI